MAAKLPIMDDPLGKHWRQPKNLRERVALYETHATISERDWLALSNYETSYPSGVYPGKVWRRGFWLVWYGHDRGGRCALGHLRALVTGAGTNVTYKENDVNRNKMMTATRFVASRTIAMRIDTGDGNVAAAVTDATQRLTNMGMNAGMAAEMAQDVRYRLEGDTELHRYQRLLATHDWTFGYSDDSRAFSAGATERARLNMIAARLDPDRKLWEEYARCE